MKSEPITAFVGPHRFLSNFYLCSILYEGIRFPSVEHAYQAAKTLRKSTRKLIAKMDHPGDAKSIGRHITLRKGWPEMKLKVMEKLLRIKFQNTGLRKRLVATGKRELVEGNWWGDTFWGKSYGHGQNHLGRLLMKIRAEING